MPLASNPIAIVHTMVTFAKLLCPTLKGVLPLWRKLFGLGLQADSSTGERCSLRGHEPSSAGLQAKAFGHQKIALEFGRYCYHFVLQLSAK